MTQRRFPVLILLAALAVTGGLIVGSRTRSHAQTAAPPAPQGPFRPAKAADRKAAIASITAQLDAFRRNDYPRAVQYQSAGLKQNFPSVNAFRQMMQTLYPEFAHYKTAKFGAAQADAAGQFVEVPITLTGQDGVTIKALYIMVREGKTYKVESVGGGAKPPPLPPGDGSIV